MIRDANSPAGAESIRPERMQVRCRDAETGIVVEMWETADAGSYFEAFGTSTQIVRGNKTRIHINNLRLADIDPEKAQDAVYVLQKAIYQVREAAAKVAEVQNRPRIARARGIA